MSLKTNSSVIKCVLFLTFVSYYYLDLLKRTTSMCSILLKRNDDREIYFRIFLFNECSRIADQQQFST